MITADIKSLKWSDFFLYTLVNPRNLYRIISSRERRGLALSFIVPIFAVIIDIISISLLSEETGFFYYKITYGWILLILIVLSKIIVSASIMDLISQFLGFNGRIRELISIINFSIFPKALILSLVYIFKILNFAPVFFYMFFSFVLFLWSAFIAIQGISEMHSISFGRALFIFIFPYIFFGIIMFFITVLIIISSIGFIFG